MTKRKMPVKLATLRFDEDGYPGFECERRLNRTLGWHRRILEANTEELARPLWLEVFTSWNFVDEAGDPIPHTPEGFDLIPDDLWAAMLKRGAAAVREAAMPRNLDGSSSKAAAEAEETPTGGQDT